jgi:hypothetical protein
VFYVRDNRRNRRFPKIACFKQLNEENVLREHIKGADHILVVRELFAVWILGHKIIENSLRHNPTPRFSFVDLQN